MFEPRTRLPDIGDPYYNRIASGGYNPCIAGNPARRVHGLDVLPNCVGYATGRFAEVIGEPRCQYLGNTNAANYIRLAKSQGLEISDEPTLGGVMVWTGGAGGYGHVAPVEAIIDKNIVQNSESEYYGKPFAMYIRKRGNGNWRDGCYWMNSSYKYAGCIVNPAVEKEDIMTYDQFVAYMDRYLADRAKLPPSYDGAEKAIEAVKEAGIMIGDPDGNFRPLSFVTRQELAQVEANLLK